MENIFITKKEHVEDGSQEKHNAHIKKFIIKQICAYLYQQKKEYDMSCEDDCRRLIYSTNLSTRFLRKLKKNDSSEGDFFDTIFWYSIGDFLRLNVIKQEGNKFTRPQNFNIPKNSLEILIDGPNKDNQIIVACGNNNTRFLYLTEINTYYYGYGYADSMSYETQFKPMDYNTDNAITAVMVHPTENTIAYANTKAIENGTIQREIHIVENAYAKARTSFFDSVIQFFSIDSFISNNTLKESPLDHYTIIDYEIKKITFFGGNTYMFLTSSGKLGMCWLKKNQDGQTILDWQIKQHTSFFIDYEPDNATKTKNGYLLNWAFLNNKGEIFICNFLMPFAKSTLFFIKQADPPPAGQYIDKLYFHNQKCGVLYKNICTKSNISYTKLVMYK